MTCARVHAGLDDLQGHLAADRLLLLGHEDEAHAALADLLQQLVRADHRAGPLGDGGSSTVATGRAAAACEEAAGLGVGAEQALDAAGAAPASPPQASSR